MSRNYSLLISGMFISSLGDGFYKIAVPLLIYIRTHSSLNMAVGYAIAYLPTILFLPMGGLLADRIDRRRLLVGGDLLSALIVGGLAWTVLRTTTPLWMIYMAIALLAGITPFYHPVFQSIVPEVTIAGRRLQANALLLGVEQIVSVIAPVLGGLVLSFWGTTSVLALDAVSFLASAALLSGLRLPQRLSARRENPASWRRDLGQAWRYVWENPLIRYGSLYLMGTNYALTLLLSNLTYLMAGLLHFTVAQVGVAYAALGGGAIVGAILAPELGRRFRPIGLISGCTAATGILTLPLLTAHSLFSLALPCAAGAAFGTISVACLLTLRQQIVPPPLLGRVVALTRMIAFLSVPFAAVTGGLLVHFFHSMNGPILLAALVRLGIGALGMIALWKARRLYPPYAATQTGLAALYEQESGIERQGAR